MHFARRVLHSVRRILQFALCTPGEDEVGEMSTKLVRNGIRPHDELARGSLTRLLSPLRARPKNSHNRRCGGKPLKLGKTFGHGLKEQVCPGVKHR
jgi:hypothetical protein